MTHAHQLQDRVIVEIGCGSPTDRRGETPKGAIGVDIDLDALRTPGGVTKPRRLVCADGIELPFRSASCDLVVLRAVLHHLTPTSSAIGELARLLRPTGRMQITDGVALDDDDAAALDAELRAAGHAPEPTYGFDLDELTALSKQAGLDIVGLSVTGRATFATPPFVSRTYSTERFTLVVERPGDKGGRGVAV